MAVLGFITGLLLMLGVYIILSLIGTVLMSYLTRKILQIIYYTLSIRERIRKQKLQFLHRKQALKKRYQSKKKQFEQKNYIRQQTLYDANTKINLHHLARETHKKLRSSQRNISPEIQHSTKQAVKQCVDQLDMERLININLSLSSLLSTLPHSQQSTEKPSNI
jgi:hypothetical protein